MMFFKVCWYDRHRKKGGTMIGRFAKAQATRQANEMQIQWPERQYWTEPIARVK